MLKEDQLVPGCPVKLYDFDSGDWECGVIESRRTEVCESWRKVSDPRVRRSPALTAGQMGR